MPHDHDHDHHDHHDHAEGEPHEHAHGEEDRRIRLLHGASPFCWWSFGYEGVIARARLLYGDQIKVNVYQIPVYEDVDEHNRSYGIDDPARMKEWMDEAARFMKVPISQEAVDKLPRSCVPGTLVVHAAELAKPGAGERLARIIGFHANVAPRELQDPAALLKLAELAGAPRKAVEQALADGRAEASMKEDGQSMHALGLNFFALQCRDFEGRTVTLEYAFDGAKVEEALEWLARGALRKQPLPKPADYAAAHAPLSLREVQEVFRLDAPKARAALEPAERSGALTRRAFLGMDFWFPRGYPL